MARPKGSKNKTRAGKETAKSGRKKFQAPVNTKTGAAGDKAAAKPAKAGAIPPGTTRQEATVAKVTPAGTLKSLLSTCRGLKQNMDEINGKLREELAFAKDKKNLHTTAFGQLRKLDKMEPERASDYWHTLVRYMELTGIMAKIESVGRLPLGEEPEAGEAEDTSDMENGEAAEAAALDAKQPAGADAPSGDAVSPKAANGGEPAPANVSRPKFGQTAPRSQSDKADEVRAAAGKPH